MAKIECTYGAAQTPVAGREYVFERDRHGRYVAEVSNDDHVKILLSVEHYRIAEEIPDPAPPQVELTEEELAALEAEAEARAKVETQKPAGEATESTADPANPVGKPAAPAPRDPLDHDENGKKGGSKPRSSKAPKAADEG